MSYKISMSPLDVLPPARQLWLTGLAAQHPELWQEIQERASKKIQALQRGDKAVIRAILAAEAKELKALQDEFAPESGLKKET